MAAEFGAEKATMTMATDGSGVVTATLHLLDGSAPPMTPIPLAPHQVAIALTMIPVAAQTLHSSLTANGGVARPQDVAGIIAQVQAWLQTPPGPAAQAGIYTAPDVLQAQ